MKSYMVTTFLLPSLFAVLGAGVLLASLLAAAENKKNNLMPRNRESISRISASNPPPTCIPGSSDYSVAVAQGTVVPGTDMIPGSHCNNCTNTISLPFSFGLYDRKFTSAIVGSNGVLGFVSNPNPGSPSCLPATVFDYAIFPDWEQMTYRYSVEGKEGGNSNANNTPDVESGVYTSVTGVAPNRIFNIEWRARDYFNVSPINVEVRLYENSPNEQFDIVYNTVNHHGGHAAVGVQKGTGSQYTQFTCLAQGRVGPGVKLTFTLPQCNLPAPSPPPST